VSQKHKAKDRDRALHRKNLHKAKYWTLQFVVSLLGLPPSCSWEELSMVADQAKKQEFQGVGPRRYALVTALIRHLFGTIIILNCSWVLVIKKKYVKSML
jgi:hypothetical protein